MSRGLPLALIRAGLLLGLALAGPGAPPARAQTSTGGAGQFSCGITVLFGGDPIVPESVSEGEEALIAFTNFPLPCGGPVTASFVVELGSMAFPGAEVRLRARVGCLGSVVGVPESGPACVEGTVIALEPQRLILPVPVEIALQPVGLDTRAVTFGGILERGRYALVIDLEVVGADVEVGKRFLHVLGAGALPALSGRVEDPGGFGLGTD